MIIYYYGVNAIIRLFYPIINIIMCKYHVCSYKDKTN